MICWISGLCCVFVSTANGVEMACFFGGAILFWFAPGVTATVAAANSVAKWHPFAPVLLFFLLDEAGV
jgi:hypothetical protein